MNTETEHTPGSLNDQRAGYPAYRAQLAAMSNRALSAEYAWVLRGTFDRIFGRKRPRRVSAHRGRACQAGVEQLKNYESTADTAKRVRKALKHYFPAVKFSVHSKVYSGGSSIDVRWTDGPR